VRIQEEVIVTEQEGKKRPSWNMNSVGKILTFAISIMSQLVAFTVLAQDNIDAVALVLDLEALPSRMG
jgi:hypothetical protein